MPTPNEIYAQAEKCQYCGTILEDGDPVFTCAKCAEFNRDPANFPRSPLGPLYLGPLMAKDPSKKRVEVHMSPELKEALVKLAKADNRSLLNYIETLLEKHVKEQDKKSKLPS